MIHLELGLRLEINEDKRILVISTDRIVVVLVVHKHDFERAQLVQIEAWNFLQAMISACNGWVEVQLFFIKVYSVVVGRVFILGVGVGREDLW